MAVPSFNDGLCKCIMSHLLVPYTDDELWVRRLGTFWESRVPSGRLTRAWTISYLCYPSISPVLSRARLNATQAPVVLFTISPVWPRQQEHVSWNMSRLPLSSFGEGLLSVFTIFTVFPCFSGALELTLACGWLWWQRFKQVNWEHYSRREFTKPLVREVFNSTCYRSTSWLRIPTSRRSWSREPKLQIFLWTKITVHLQATRQPGDQGEMNLEIRVWQKDRYTVLVGEVWVVGEVVGDASILLLHLRPGSVYNADISRFGTMRMTVWKQ